MKYRLPVSVFLFSAAVVLPVRSESPPPSGPIVRGATLARNIPVTMSDGIRLAADVLLPEGEWPFPVILYRNPYDKNGVTEGEARDFVREGFAVVSQDCRGRFRSEGGWDPFRYERRDGLDTVRWIRKQPWCNGKIGLAGGSYLGFTQCINAPDASPYLTSMNPAVPFGNAYHDCVYWGGALRFQLVFFWGTVQAFSALEKQPPDFSDGKLFKTLPLREWDKGVGVRIHYLRDWVAHPNHDDYWKMSEVDDSIENVTIPSLYIGGWYDIFQNGIIDYWNGVRLRSKDPKARQRQYLIMGPWTHGISPKDGRVGDLDFGEHSDIHPSRLRMNWFKETLLGQDLGMADLPPLRIYVMGRNIWRDEFEWPLARTEFRKLYLHADSPANTLEGGGILSWNLPETETATDTFVYDPEDPVPTKGGALLWHTAGPRDQTEVEKRKDVLVYSSEVLQETLEVTGPIRLVLFAESTAPDTDFTGKLVDVHPTGGKNGTPYNITDGILRARFRESDVSPSLIEPGKIYRYEIDLGCTSTAFLPGHRIRLEVSSSNFPRFDRNPNTGHPFGSDDMLVPATQTIYHDPQYPSHLILPVIPSGSR